MGSSKSRMKENAALVEMVQPIKSTKKNEFIREKNTASIESAYYEKQLKESVKKIRLLLDCENWRNENDSAWENIDEIDFNDIRNIYKLSQEDVELILKNCGINLNKLIITANCNSTIMPIVSKYCHNLKEFEFNLSHINDDDFNGVFKNMKKLKSITVRTYHPLFNRNKENPVDFYHMSDTKLKKLVVKNNPEIGEKKNSTVDVSKILESLPDEINEILLLTHKAIVKTSQSLQNFPNSLERFKNLRYLSLKMFKLNDNAIMEISNRKSLIKLEFDSCTFEENTSLLLSLPALELLTLQSMENIDDCLINITNESKNLKHLSLINCKNVSVNAFKKLSSLINLEYLNIPNLQCLDDDIISGIADECKNLQHINISRCKNISQDAIVKLTNLQSLKYLDIRDIQNINDNLIINIGNNCKKLTNLYIKSCKNVSNSALDELAKLENLETLCLVEIDNIGDQVFKNMHKLESFTCTHCPNVTDDGITRIIEKATSLKALVVCRTGITYKSLVCATYETKKRENNILLEVIVDEEIFKEYQALGFNSGPLISLRGVNM